MKRKKLRQLAKQINNGNDVNINFVFAPSDHFSYLSSHTLEISLFFYRLPRRQILVYLAHEIGHLNTVPTKIALYTSDYTMEYEANKWALYRLDELDWFEVLLWYTTYLQELSRLEPTDENDEEYQEAATDLLLELELT
jgi:hypothetical protein